VKPSVRIGVTLPTFTDDATAALRAATTAEAGGLEGVFAFDHLWPMGNPGRPALWSFGVLAAVAASTVRVCVGPLVARVGLLPEDDLLAAFDALAAVAGRSRVIAGLGMGDHLSAQENLAYGVEYPSAARRKAELERVAAALVARGLVTWIGGLSATAASVSRAVGTGRNLWGVSEAEIAEASRAVPVGWAGQVLVGRDGAELAELRDRFGDRPGLVAGTVEEVAARIARLRDAGASWWVAAPLDYLARPERAVETICLVRQAVP
jgi:alkanesulfonate monooxygenase SsuD/methylene tetrahydromethanopterin reductase-like flavin-dependent oxidoreductase (luciferase family)